MTNSGKSAVSFGGYIILLSKIVFSSTLVLGLIIGGVLLVLGETSMDLDIGLDLSAIDGLLLMLGLPVFFLLVFAILSPLSFFVYRLLSGSENATPDA
jgi:hypothetical protein